MSEEHAEIKEYLIRRARIPGMEFVSAITLLIGALLGLLFLPDYIANLASKCWGLVTDSDLKDAKQFSGDFAEFLALAVTILCASLMVVGLFISRAQLIPGALSIQGTRLIPSWFPRARRALLAEFVRLGGALLTAAVCTLSVLSLVLSLLNQSASDAAGILYSVLFSVMPVVLMVLFILLVGVTLLARLWLGWQASLPVTEQ